MARHRAAHSPRGHYYTVIIPYVGAGATRWHPTEATGPFKTLSRGAFNSQREAHAWAKGALGGHPYSLMKRKKAE